MISFAGLSFSVTDIELDVILLVTVPLEECSHEFMELPMGGVCVIQQDSYYWLIPSSPVIWLAFQPSKKNHTWELAFQCNVLREEEYVICKDLFPN